MTVTTETELSTQYRALRTVIRPFRPRLATPGKPLPAGSPRLKNAPKVKYGFKFVERQESEIWQYDLTPEVHATAGTVLPPASAPKRHIYYFSGGAFQSPPTGAHWGIVATLAKNLAKDGYEVTMVSYPLAPNTPAVESLSMLQKWLRGVIESAAAKGDSILLMGDSAGANIALSLTFWWIKECASMPEAVGSTTNGESSAIPLKSVLKDAVVISPVTDMHNSHPDMEKVNKLDPILSKTYTGAVAEQWSKGFDKSDPLVSPVFNTQQDFEQLRSLGIKIHGVIGTHDVLSPDALKFKDLCIQYGVEGDWLIWEGQMHCFPLASSYGIKEGKAALEWLSQLLKKEVLTTPQADA